MIQTQLSLIFFSLPTGSFVTVGFVDETVIDGVGNDFLIQEVGGNAERENVFVSANLVDFVFIGIAVDNASTSFDLVDIGFTDSVQSINIVGLDSLGGSPGFDVVNIQVLPGSIGEAPDVLEPATFAIFGLGLAGLGFTRRERSI